MKKYIREILDDLKLAPAQKKPEPIVATDIDNQIPAKNPVQRLRQLDQQAQKSKERQISS